MAFLSKSNTDLLLEIIQEENWECDEKESLYEIRKFYNENYEARFGRSELDKKTIMSLNKECLIYLRGFLEKKKKMLSSNRAEIEKINLDEFNKIFQEKKNDFDDVIKIKTPKEIDFEEKIKEEKIKNIDSVLHSFIEDRKKQEQEIFLSQPKTSIEPEEPTNNNFFSKLKKIEQEDISVEPIKEEMVIEPDIFSYIKFRLDEIDNKLIFLINKKEEKESMPIQPDP